jgi:hypothetical protein
MEMQTYDNEIYHKACFKVRFSYCFCVCVLGLAPPVLIRCFRLLLLQCLKCLASLSLGSVAKVRLFVAAL